MTGKAINATEAQQLKARGREVLLSTKVGTSAKKNPNDLYVAHQALTEWLQKKGAQAPGTPLNAPGIGDVADPAAPGRPDDFRTKDIPPVSGDGSTFPVDAPDAGSGQPIPKPQSVRGQMMGWAVDQLKKEGVPEANARAAAAHLVGQAENENDQFDPNAVHDGGRGRGIYGANGDRLKAMDAWLSDNGYAKNSREGQMRYMAHEAMTDKAYAKTRGTLMSATPDSFSKEGVAGVTGDFERPAVINDRSGAVKLAYGEGGASAPAEAQKPQPGTLYAVTQEQRRTPDASGFGAQTHGFITINGHSYEFVNGGRGRGSIPFGTYKVGGFATADERSRAGLLNLGDTFSLNDVHDPMAPGPDRSELLIHSAERGTAGCIGIRGGPEKFAQFTADMKAAGVKQIVLGPQGSQPVKSFNPQEPGSVAIKHDIDLRDVPTIPGASIQPADLLSLSPKDYDRIMREARPYAEAIYKTKTDNAVANLKNSGTQSDMSAQDMQALRGLVGPKAADKFQGQMNDAQQTWAINQNVQNMDPSEQAKFAQMWKPDAEEGPTNAAAWNTYRKVVSTIVKFRQDMHKEPFETTVKSTDTGAQAMKMFFQAPQGKEGLAQREQALDMIAGMQSKHGVKDSDIQVMPKDWVGSNVAQLASAKTGEEATQMLNDMRGTYGKWFNQFWRDAVKAGAPEGLQVLPMATHKGQNELIDAYRIEKDLID